MTPEERAVIDAAKVFYRVKLNLSPDDEVVYHAKKRLLEAVRVLIESEKPEPRYYVEDCGVNWRVRDNITHQVVCEAWSIIDGDSAQVNARNIAAALNAHPAHHERKGMGNATPTEGSRT